MVDGCPVIELPDDSEDLTKLLKYMYYPELVPRHRLRKTTFDFLAPILRLAVKYQMERISAALIPRIQEDWPSTLKGWDLLEGDIRVMLDNNLYQDETSPNAHLDDVLVEPASAIKLAKELRIPGVLPAAFYHLSRLCPLYNLDGDVNDYKSHVSKGGRTAALHLLQLADVTDLYLGQARIRAWTLCAMKNPWGMPLGKGCRCYVKLNSQELAGILLRNEVDVLAGLQKIISTPESTSCGDCSRSWTKAREDLWNLLPEFFRLDPTGVKTSSSDAV